ncbi:MAG: transcription initiation factor IIB family protein [Promethearchaeota archaeon]
MTYCKEKIDNWASIRPQKDNICCFNPNIIQDNGYYVCTNCGIIHSRIIEERTRIIYKTAEKKAKQSNERVYLPIGSRTVIKGYRDGKGNLLTPKSKSDFERLAKINRGFTNGFERNLLIALPIFNRLKFLFNIPDYVAKDAYKIYRFAAKRKMTRGRSIEALSIASIYCSLRINNIPILLDNIIKNTNITKREFFISFKVLFREVLPNLNLRFKTISPIKYIDKFIKEMNKSMECRQIAIDLIENSKQHGFVTSGKDPKGIAAASLYLSARKCEETLIQKDICKLANISEVTMRARMYELIKFSSPTK